MTQDPSRPDDLSGRTAIVTGANSGIGYETARALAARGAHVVLAVRNIAAGRRAADQLAGSLEVRQVDLADLQSVGRFVTEWAGRPIEWLINNAGISSPTLRRNGAGTELQFATNHVGPFALTIPLLSCITGRVITVSSQAERQARIDFADLNWERRSYKASRAYANSKQANLLFTAELQRRLEVVGSPVLAMAAHPGFVATNIYNEVTNSVARAALRVLAQDAVAGAQPTLFATLADLPGNSFIGPRHLLHMRGGAEPISRSRAAADPSRAGQLWDVSESLTGITWPTGISPRAS